MKRFYLIALSLVVMSSLFFTGCATVQVASENGRTMVDAENTSWRILWWLPIGGGDCVDPNGNYCVWFNNTVTLKNNMQLLDYARDRKKARSVKDIQTFYTDDYYLFILRRSAMHTSAELVY